MCKCLKIAGAWVTTFLAFCTTVGTNFLKVYIDHITPSPTEAWWASTLDHTSELLLVILPFVVTMFALAVALTITMNTSLETK